MVDPPTPEETCNHHNKLKSKYEEYHNVEYESRSY
jgi:ATP-dependent Clp protease ATP-binding subunit ClpA